MGVSARRESDVCPYDSEQLERKASLIWLGNEDAVASSLFLLKQCFAYIISLFENNK